MELTEIIKEAERLNRARVHLSDMEEAVEEVSTIISPDPISDFLWAKDEVLESCETITKEIDNLNQMLYGRMGGFIRRIQKEVN